MKQQTLYPANLVNKIILFEPWHLGDVAVCLSATKELLQPDIEFILVCNKKWKEWALSTGVVNHIIEFAPPWTFRNNTEKYNPLNYSIKEIRRFRREVLQHHPNLIIELRGDIRATFFLKLLFGNKIKINSSDLSSKANVYSRGEIVKRRLDIMTTKLKNKIQHVCNNRIALFFGAADYNRRVPDKTALELIIQLHAAGYHLSLILQPGDNAAIFQNKKVEFNLPRLEIFQGAISEIVREILDSFLVISTDSGWLHVAYFYNKATIGLFGFNTMETWAPPGATIVTSEIVFPDFYRYKRKYRSIQPLENLQANKVLEVVRELEKKGASLQLYK